MNADSKERLKAMMEKYPRIRELIKTGDYDTLWKGLFDTDFNETLTGPGTAMCWNPMYACFFMTAFAESGINCKLKEIPEYLAAEPITPRFLFDLRIPDGVEKIGDSAFWDCYKLTNIYIPNSVKVIDDDAFAFTSNRFSITGANKIPERNITIPARFKDDLKRIGINCPGSKDTVTFI